MPLDSPHLDRPRRTPVPRWVVLFIPGLVGALAAAIYVADNRDRIREQEVLRSLVTEIVLASQIQAAAERMVSMNRAYLLTDDPELLARAQAAQSRIQLTLGRIERRAAARGQEPSLEKIKGSARRYSDRFQTLAQQPTSGGPLAVAEALKSRLLPERDRFLADLDHLIADRYEQIETIYAVARDRTKRTVRLALVLGVLGVLAAGVLLTVPAELRARTAGERPQPRRRA